MSKATTCHTCFNYQKNVKTGKKECIVGYRKLQADCVNYLDRKKWNSERPGVIYLGEGD